MAVVMIASSAAFAATSNAQADRRDFWRGAAAGAVAGAITGAIINKNRRDRRYYHRRPHRRTIVIDRYDDRHIRWCSRKYRSYHVRSDTYQPYHGPRRRCYSPYN